MLRILIVDDQKSICETLKTVLSSEPDFEIAGVAHDGATAIELAKKLLPDLMLVDLEMPGINGLDLTRIISQYLPHIKIIVLSTHDRDEYLQQTLQAGAMSYLLKNTDAEDLKASIRFVSRGYTQFSPGLLPKIVSFLETEPAKRPNRNSYNSVPLGLEKSPLAKSDIDRQPRIRKSWKYYFPYWLIGNGVLWGLAIAYLVFNNPTYTSEWLVSLSSNQNLSIVKAANKSSVTARKLSSNNSSLVDPRENYISLFGRSEILASAAQKLEMTPQEFGKPTVKMDNNDSVNSTIKLSIKGNSPEEARQKAIAYQQVIQEKLGKLQPQTANQVNPNLPTEVEQLKQTLSTPQRAVNSPGDEGENIAADLEYLRSLQTETKAQIRQARNQAQQLANSLGITPEMAGDIDLLGSDSSFQKYWSEYNRLNVELLELESIFQPQNPILMSKQEEVKTVRTTLMQRGRTLLGRSLSDDTFQQLSLGMAEDNNYYRGSSLKQIVSLQSEVDFLSERLNSINLQITKLEAKENVVSQQTPTSSPMEQGKNSADNLDSADFAQSGDSSAADTYPLIKFATRPSLAKKPSSSNPQLVYWGALMGSILLTTAIAIIWANSKETTSALYGETNRSSDREQMALPLFRSSKNTTLNS